MNKLNGEWLSRYSYQSGEGAEPISSEHIVVFDGNDKDIVGRSIAQEDGSELSLNLHYDEENSTLTGTWQEMTSPEGIYRGAAFHGALQLILNEMNTVADGKWVGFNSSRTKVKTGDWQIEKKQS